MKRRITLNIDARASVIVFLALILIQIFFVLIKKDFNYLFGVEYGNIAENLIAGNGFSNPLPPSNTGPTAWVPPVLVLIISGGFLLFGKTFGAFIFLSVIKFICYAVVFYFLLKTLRLVDIKVYHAVLAAIFLLYILFSPRDNFESIHDFWLPQLLVMLFIYHSIKYYTSETKHPLALYIIIFLSPLINPSYALAFMVVIGFITFVIPLGVSVKTRNNVSLFQTAQKGLVRILGFCLVFTFSIALWTVRNYLVFDKFIPTKSNMWFEFYLTNVVDTDGKLSQSALYKAHPIYNESLRKEMLAEGESNWLEKYDAISHEYLSHNLKDYLYKIKNRLVLGFIYTETDRDNIRSMNFGSFSEQDKLLLTQNKLIIGQAWTTGFFNDERMSDILNTLHPDNKELIFEDWKMAKNDFYHHKYQLPDFVRGIFFGIIPTLCIAALIIFRRTRFQPLLLISSALYLVYLLPYILISHQIRYQRPLFILQVILVYMLFASFYKYFIVDKKLNGKETS